MRIQKIEVMVATPDDGEPLDIGFCNRICCFKLAKPLKCGKFCQWTMETVDIR